MSGSDKKKKSSNGLDGKKSELSKYVKNITRTPQKHEISELFVWPARQGETEQSHNGMSFDVVFGEHRLETKDFIGICTLTNAMLRVTHNKCRVVYDIDALGVDGELTKETVYTNSVSKSRKSHAKSAASFGLVGKLSGSSGAVVANSIEVASADEALVSKGKLAEESAKISKKSNLVRPVSSMRWKFGFGSVSRENQISLEGVFSGLGLLEVRDFDVRYAYSFEPINEKASVTATLSADVHDLNVEWLERSVVGRLKSVLSANKKSIAKMLFLRQIGGQKSKSFQVSQCTVRFSAGEQDAD